jgi:hypothetical protein
MHALLPEMRRRHHRAERRLDRALRVGEEAGDPGECFVLLGVKHMKDGADEQGVAGLFPVVPFLERAFGVDQHVGDVLDVADLQFPRRTSSSGL